MHSRFVTGRAFPLLFGLLFLIVSLFIAGQHSVAQGTWPNCAFNCTAKDVVLTRVYADIPPGICEPGTAIATTLWGVFDANATRYAVWLLADVYLDGAFVGRIEQCVVDTIFPGISEVALATISFQCGSSLELRNVIVSWSPTAASCADLPKCAARRAKCSTPLLGTLQVSTPVVVDFASDAPQCAGDLIVFTDLTTGGDGIYSYGWDFGDFFGTSTEVNPSYTYSSPGTYTVTLTVTDGAGTTDLHTYDVTVLDCLRTLSLVSQQGGEIVTPGEGVFSYATGSRIDIQAVPESCWQFDGWAGDTDLLDDPTSSSTFATLNRDAVLEATFSFRDDSPPTLTCPPDVTIECGEPIEPAAIGWATAIDDCDPNPSISYVDAATPGACPGETIITRVWTAEDISGNTAQCEQRITVVDTTPPMLSIPNATFECDGTGNTEEIDAWLASPIAADACGTVTVSHDYTGLANVCPGTGTATVAFRAEDACGNITEWSVALTVVDTIPPFVSNDFADTVENTPVTLDVLQNDSDQCEISLRIDSVGTPLHGLVSISGSAVEYRPNIGFAGADTFSYVASDCSGKSALGLVEIRVAAINDPPDAQNQTHVTREDTHTGFFSLAISDPDNTLAELECDCVRHPEHGTVERGANHTVNYTPNPDFSGEDSFEYIVCDPEGLCDTATVTMTVTNENDNPVVAADYHVTPEDTPVDIPVTYADPDDDYLVCTASDPAHGQIRLPTALISPAYPRIDWLTYVPDPDFHGVDTFTVTCDDGKGGSDTVSIEVTVFPVNDPPIARDETRTTMEDRSTGFFSLDIADSDNTLAEIVCDCVEPPAHGTVERGPDHTVNYTPAPGFSGTDMFVYEVCDPDGLCSTATVTIDVVAPPCQETITFDRRLSGRKVGQHKAPPREWVEVTVFVETSDPIDDAVLSDIYPEGWIVADAGGGTVYGNQRTITWDIGELIGSASRTYTVLSPEKTIPPTQHYFQSTLTYDPCTMAGDPWRVVIADPTPELTATLSGSTQMAPLNQGTFTITVTNNDPTQSACGVVITSSMPNAEFSYVLGSSTLTLHDGTSYAQDPTVSGLDLIWDLDAIVGAAYQLPPNETLTIVFDMATSAGAYTGTDTVTMDYADCVFPTIPFQGTTSEVISIVSIDGCIDDVTGTSNVCTANDVRVSSLTVLEVVDGCTSPQDTACLLLRAELIATAADRYDIGMFWSLDGGDARTGLCAHNYLPPPLAAAGAYNPDGGPFLDVDGDACGDIEQGVSTFYYLPEYCFDCNDVDGDGFLDIGTALSWDNKADATNCAGIAGAIPGTKAKCRVETLGTNVEVPDLRLTKTADTSFVANGGTVLVTIAYSNVAFGNAHLISFVDDYDETLGSVSNISSGGVDDGDTITWTIGTIAPGTSGTLTYEYTVNADVPGGTVIPNIVQTYYDGTPNPPTATNEVGVLYWPEIAIAKSGPATAAVGATVTYTFAVTNDDVNGDGTPIQNVTVTDTIAVSALYVSGDDGDSLLQVGETWIFQASYTVLPTDPDPLNNTGTVNGQDLDGDPLTAQDSHSLTVDSNPAIDIVKTGPATVDVGGAALYTFTVTNDSVNGDGSPISSVSVSDSLAGAASYVSGDDGDSILQASESWVFQASYVVQPTDPDPLGNTATASGIDADGDPVSDTDTHSLDVAYNPAIAIVKTGPATANVGDAVTYTFTVTNDNVNGDGSPIQNVAVADSLAGIAAYVSGDDGDGLLEVGESWIFEATRTVAPTDPDPLGNTGTVTGQDLDGDPVNAVDTHSLDVAYNPAIDVVKSCPATYAIGDTVVYSFTVTNDTVNGDGSAIQNVAVADDLTVAGTYISGDDGDNLLEVGETWLFQASYVILPTDPDPLVNIATTTGQDLDGDPVSDQDVHSLDPAFNPAIDVVKTGPASGNVGDTVTYTFTVTNDTVNGDGSPISNVALSDSLAGTASYISGDDTDGLLEPGEIWTYQATYVVQPDDPDPLVNTGTVSGLDKDGDVVSDADTHSLGVAYNPEILVVKTGPANANIGDTVTYTFAVSNDDTAGDGSVISTVAVSDTVAGVAAYVAGDDGDNLLEVGEIWMFEATKTILASDPDPLPNTGTSTGQDLDGDLVTDPDSHSVVVAANPAIDIVKSGPAAASVGDVVTYTFTITNDTANGDGSPISNLSVSDSLAGSTTFVSGDDGDGLLEIGETWTYQASYTIQPTYPDPLGNTATVNGLDTDGDPLSDTDTHSLAVAYAPAIQIVKSGPSSASVGDAIVYTFIVTNDTVNGDGSPIANVSVNDSLTGGASYVSGDDGDNLLEVGETWTFQATYTIQPTDPDPLLNTGTASGQDLDGDAVSDTDNHSLNVAYNPAIAVVKTGPASASVGDAVTYTFTLTNDFVNGDGSPIANVSVSDSLAGVANYLSGDDGDSLLEVGEIWTFQATYTIPPTSPDPLVNTGTSTGQDLDGDTVTDTAAHSLAVAYAPAIDIVKSGPSTANVGDTITYTFVVSNDTVNGDGSAIENVSVSDDVAGTALFTTGDDGDGLLEAGESWTYQVSYTTQPTDPDPLTNIGTVTGQDLDGDSLSDTDTHTLDGQFDPAIAVVKGGPASANVGDTVTYTFTVTNDIVNGDGSPIVNVSVSDSLAGAASYLSGDDGDNLLESGETWTFQATYTVQPNDPDPLVNTATVLGQDSDGDIVTDQDVHSLDVEYNPALSVLKTGPSTANVGDTVTYVLEQIINDPILGDGSPIANVSASDSLAGVATYVSGDDGDDLLEVGEVWTFSVSYAVLPDAFDPLGNTGTVSGEDLDGDPISNSSDHSLDVEFNPALSIVKSGPATGVVGDTITYSFTVANDSVNGDGSTIANIAVNDSLAGPATYVAGDDGDNLLEVGENWLFQASYTIQPTDPDPLVNTGTATGEDRDGDPVSDQDSHSLDSGADPAIAIAKSGPATAAVGDSVTYTFVVTNDVANGDGSPIDNVFVADSLAGSASYVSGDDGDNLLKLGETWSYQASYTVQPTDPDPLGNTATVSGTDRDGDPVSDTDTHSLDVAYGPAIGIIKSGPLTADAGDVVTYTFEVTNDSLAGDGSPIQNVAVSDSVAGTTTYISGDDGDGLLEVGETWTYQSSDTIQPTDHDPLVNTATVTGEDLDGDPLSNTDSHSLNVEFNPAIRVVKTGLLTANVGDTVIYTFTVTNDTIAGDGSAISAVTLGDSLTGTPTYLAGDDGDSLLEVGETWVYQSSHVVGANDPDPLLNTATVSAQDRDGDPLTDQDVHSLDVEFTPAINLVKSGPASATVGDTITYTFSVSHDLVAGDGSPISNLGVTDSLAGSATYVSGDDGDGLLEAGETWIYEATLTVQPTDPDPLANTATATGIDRDGEPVSAQDSHTTAIEYAPIILVVKAGLTSADVGSTVTYTFSVTNDATNGDGSPISGVSVSDNVAGVASYVSGDDGDSLLEVGETWIFRTTQLVSVSPDPLVNTATVIGQDLDGDPVTDTDTHSLDVEHNAAIDIVKSGPATADAGDTVTYTFAVTNDAVSGDGSPISNISVFDSLAGTAGYISGDDGDSLLEIGETWTYQATYTIQPTDPDPLGNIATSTGLDPDGDSVSDTDDHTLDIEFDPSIQIVKSGPASASVGDTVTYAFTVTNDPITGDGSAISLITVSDSVAGAASYVSGDDGDGLLEVGEIWTYQAAHTVLPTDPDPLVNTVTIIGQDRNGDVVSDADSHILAVEYAPAISLVKSGPASSLVGNTVTYAFTVINDDVSGDGSVVANLTVSDNIAGSAVYVSGDDGDGLLEVGETWSFQATYTIQPGDSSPLVNSATAHGEDLDGDDVTDQDSHSLTIVFAPAIEIVKSGPSTAGVGDTITYTFIVTNDTTSGDGSPIASVSVTDDVAGSALFTTGDDGDGLLEAGESWIYQASYTIQPADPDPLTNIGTVSGQDLDGDPLSDTDTHSLDGQFDPVIAVVKSGPANATVGDTVTYTFAVSNDAVNGDGSPIANVSVSDSIAGTASYLSGDDGNNLLEAGENWTFQASYTIQPSDPDPLSNTATASGTDQDNEPVSGQDSHTLDVEYAPALDVLKSGPSSANVGDTVTYSFAVTNDAVTGDGSAIANVSISDSLAGAASYVSGDDGDNLLEVGETWTFQATYTVQSTDIDPLQNTGTGTGEDPDGDPVIDTDTHSLDVEYAPAVLVNKSGPASASIGDTVTYTFAVTNDAVNGDGSAIGNVDVSDSLAGSAAYVSGDDGDNLLEGGETWTFQATYTIQPTDPDPLTNIGTVTGQDPDGDPVSDQDTHTTAINYEPALAITKAGPITAAVGDTVTYTFFVTNDAVNGDGSAIANVGVSDNFAGSAIYLSGDDGDNLLEVGETWTFQATYIVQPTDPDPLSNIGTVTGEDNDGDPVTESDTHSLNVEYAPAIQVSKTGPASANVGDTVTYTFSVSNDSVNGDDSPMVSVSVSDSLAGAANYVSGDDGDTFLEVGETWTFQVSYTVQPTDPDRLQNTGTATAQDLDGNPVSDQDTHDLDVSYAPAIAVSKSGPSSANVGDTVTYTFTVINDPVNGDSSPIVNPAVSDSLGGLAIYLFGDDGDSLLEVGETWTFQATYIIQPTDPDPLTNTATATGQDSDGNIVTDQDTHNLDVAYNPAIVVVKAGPATANVGDTVTYTFTVTNDIINGDGSAIGNLSVADSLAGTAGYISGDDGDTALEVGEIWTFQVSYTIQPTDPDPLTNTATASGNDGDGDPVSGTDDHDLDVIYNPAIDITKTGPATASVGDTVTYTFTVINDTVNGDGSPVSNLSVADSVTGAASYVSGDDGDNLLEAGETWIYQAQETLTADSLDPHVNTATATGQDPEGDPITDQDSHSLDVEYSPAIAVAKNGPAAASVGDSVLYTFTVTNDAVNGDGSPVSSLSINDSVAGAASYVSGDDGDLLLEVGEAWTFQASYTVQATDPDPLSNTATASGIDSDGDSVSDQDSHSLDLGFSPVLAINKTGPSSAAVGDSVTYAFSVTNNALAGDGSPIQNVTVADDIAGPAAYVSGDDGDSLLEVGETWTFQATYTVQPTDPDPLVNTGTATGQDLDGDAVSDTDTHSLGVAYNPAIAVAKIGPASASVGDTATYTFTVTNDTVNGDGSPIASVGVSDSLAGAANYLSGDDGDGLLEVGETWTFQASYVLPPTSPDPLVNTGTATGQDLDGDPVSDTDDHSLAVAYAPAIDIAKSGPSTANVGDTITYTFVVSHDTVNGDSSPIQNVAVTDDIAGPATYVSGDDGDTLLELGENWTYQASYTIQPADPDPLTNIGTVSGQDLDGDPLSDTDTHSLDGQFDPVIAVVKSGPANATVGDTVTYTFAVSNDAVNGDGSPIANVSVSDSIAGTASYLSGDDGNNLLEAGENWTFQASYTIQPSDPDPLSNTATASGTDQDNEPVSGQDSHTLDVEYAPALDVLKSGPSSANVGDTVTYSFAVTNDAVTGDGSAIANVSISDSLAGAASYVSGDDGDNLLEVGETWTFQATYTVQSTDIDPLQNTGTGTGEDPDGDPVIDTDTHSLDVEYAPAVLVNKSGPASASIGDTVTYTFAVTNDAVNGDGSAIGNVDVSDSLAGSAAYVSGDDGDNLLEGGETWTFQATYTIQPTDPDPLTNIGTVTGQDPDGDPVSDQDTHTTAINYEPALAITKAGPITAAVGDTVTYTFFVTNDAVNGDGSAIANVGVSDNFAGSAIYLSGDDGDNLLEVGETWTFQATYIVQPTDPDPLSNIGTVTGEDNDGDPVTESDTHSLNVEYAPAIQVSKTGPASANVGGAVTYTFSVSNDALNGDSSPIVSVAVSDSLAGTASYLSGDDGDTFLEVGETWVYTATYTIQPTDPDPLVNTATVTGQDPDADPVTDQDGHTTNISYAPAIAVSKSGPPTAAIGDTVTYTFTVTNDAVNGDGSSIASVSVTDSLTGSAMYVSGDDGDTLLEAGENWVFEADYTIQPTDPELLANTGTATGEDSDGDPVVDIDGHTLDMRADLALTKTDSPDPVVAGDVLTYTIIVTNNGPAAALNTTLVDDISIGLLSPEISIDDGSTWKPWAGSLALGAIDAGASRRFLLRATVALAAIDGQLLLNTAEVFSDTSDPIPDNNTADEVTTISAQADLAIEKVDSADPVARGASFVYTIRVRNDGPTEAVGVVVNEAIPDHTNWIAINASKGSYDAILSVWNVGALGSGETATLALEVEVDPSFTGVLKNTATINSETPDPVSFNNTSTEVTTVLPVLGGGGVAEQPALPCERFNAVADRIWFETDQAMYAASESEFALAAAEEAEWVFRAGDLLPTGVRSLRDRGGEIAFDNLIQVNVASQIGVSLAFGPRVVKQADERSITPEQALADTLDAYARTAGLSQQERPASERWIVVEYAGGDPRYTERIDDIWPSGRWTVIDRRIVPSAVGMGLRRQVIEAEKRLVSDRPLDRYLALVLTEAMVNKLIVLDEALALEILGGGIRAYAHEYAVRGDARQRLAVYEPIDLQATLFDHLSLLWGLSAFVAFSDPAASPIFGTGASFGAEFHDLAVRLQREVLSAIATLLRDEEGRMRNSYDVEQGIGYQASIVNVGLLLGAIEQLHATTPSNSIDSVTRFITDLAAQLLDVQKEDGGFSMTFEPRSDNESKRELSTQAAAMSGLLVGYRLTGGVQYLSAAERVFDYLESEFWDTRLGVYAETVIDEEKFYCYTPLALGSTAGALRDLAAVTETEKRGRIYKRLGRFFHAVVDEASLQLSDKLGEGTYGPYAGSGYGQIGPLQIADRPLSVAPVLQQRLCLEAEEDANPCCGVAVTPDPWFQTDIAMYAAYEIQAMTPRWEDIADANLSSLVLHSGMGVPLSDGQKRDTRERYARLAGLEAERVPMISPLSLEFAAGSPRLETPERLAWDETTFYRRIVGSAIGMTLLHEAREAAQLLSERRGDLYGRTPEQGFFGLMLISAITDKLDYLEAISETMRRRVGQAYIPHATRRGEVGDDYEILDSSSQLTDQLALLWGLSETYALVMDAQFSSLFGPSGVFPQITRDRILKLLDIPVATLADRHFDDSLPVLVDRSALTMDGWQRDAGVLTETTGLVMASLEHLFEHAGDVPRLRNQATIWMRLEADFLLNRLRGNDGWFANYYAEDGVDTTRLSELLPVSALGSQLAAIRGLLAAFDVLGDEAYLLAAREAYAQLEIRLPCQMWVETPCGVECYVGLREDEDAVYTPLEIGLAVGALERLARQSDPSAADAIRGTLRALFTAVVQEASLQLPGVLWDRASGAAEPEAVFFSPVLAREITVFFPERPFGAVERTP